MQKSLFLIVTVTVLLVSCTPGPNELIDCSEEAAGFWLGLWHGFTVLFTFIWSLFSDGVNIYEVNNNGTWYNLGFLIGVMTFFGGSGGGACKRSKR